MKVFELDWGLYPRRLTIYLAEKGIAKIEHITFDALASWPSPEVARLNPLGTVPILETDEGERIGASLAILEYLEEQFPSPNLLGASPIERARTRELVSVIDEAAIQFLTWARNASPLFASFGPQSAEAAHFGEGAYHGRLRLLDKLIGMAAGPFLAGPNVSIADCITMATLQFAENFYGVPVPANCPALEKWYADFKTRRSAQPCAYPAPLLALAHGLPTTSSAIPL